MQQTTIDKFLESASLKMPDIINCTRERRGRRELYHDNAVLSMALAKPMTARQFIEATEGAAGLTMMYHHQRSLDTDFGQSLCFFQEPGLGCMYQLDATTDGGGMIESVDIRLYYSLEVMVASLRSQLSRVNAASGHFAYKIEEHELISYFL